MSARKHNVKRRIAPRLADGHSRVGFGSRLPEGVKEGLRSIAHREGKSMSWVMEEVIIDYFGLRKPEYVPTKADLEEKHQVRTTKALSMGRKSA